MSTRSSERRRIERAHYHEEQAASHYHALELLDLRRAAEESLRPDTDETSDEEPPAWFDADEEEKEKEPAATAPQWSTEAKPTHLPPFTLPTGIGSRCRHLHSPESFFTHLLPSSLMDLIAQHTTAYAHHCGACSSWSTSTAEMYAFIGIMVYMGIAPLPQVHMYWSDLYSHSFVTSAFPRHRFMELLRYFHVSDPSHARNDDKLQKIRPLLTTLQSTFSTSFLPPRNMTIDECMVGFKGRSGIKQYVKGKPVKWGYKVWAVVSDNYLLNFQVYEGKGDSHEQGLAHHVVMSLTQPWHGQQHLLFMDNFFSSPALYDALQRVGMRACGTVRLNRRDMPKALTSAKDQLEQGEYAHQQRRDLTALVWRDRKPVFMLSTHCSALETTHLERTKADGTVVHLPCPKIVEDYNLGRGAVDTVNQLHSNYYIGRKSSKWWPRLAWWLIDMCIVNAYRLHSFVQQGQTQLAFRQELMHALVSKLAAAPRDGKGRRGPQARSKHGSEHWPQRVEEQGDCVQCSKRSENRVRSRIICKSCHVHLCIDPCFELFHKQCNK